MKLLNYYYEFPEDVSVLGRPGGGYYVQRGILPVYFKGKAVDYHEAALMHAIRVWEEYEGGQVNLIKNFDVKKDLKSQSLDYNEKDFLLVKLRVKELP